MYLFTYHNRNDWGHHDDIAAQECRETRRTSLDFPRGRGPASQESRDDRTSSQIQPAREQECEVVTGCDRVCRDVGTQRCETKGKSTKECCCAVGPEGYDGRWIPVQGAIDLVRAYEQSHSRKADRVES